MQIWPLIESGRIKVYSCDSIAGRAWIEDGHAPLYRARLQNAYDSFIYREVVPAIRADCKQADAEIVSAGASLGAFNAVASLCRHPDVFRCAIGMSGTYDLQRWLQGQFFEDFYFSSPLHYLPNLGESPQLDLLRRRFVLLAYVGGRWENPEESWRMARGAGRQVRTQPRRSMGIGVGSRLAGLACDAACSTWMILPERCQHERHLCRTRFPG